MGTLDWSRHALRSLVALNDGPWRWKQGIQAGLAAGIPLTLFTLTGHQADGLIAMLGAFTALYTAYLPLVERLRVLPFIATGLVVAAAIGATTSGSIWTTVLGLLLVAILAVSLAFGLGVGPPGPMMFVLVAGVAGHITAPASLGGVGADSARIILLIAIGAFSAYLIVVAPLALPFVLRQQPPSRPSRVLLSFAQLDDIARTLMIRILLAVTVTSIFSVPLGVPRAYWAIMTAGVLLQTGHTLQVPTRRAIQRVVGTLIGVAIFSLLGRADPGEMQLVLTVAICQCMTEVVIVRNYGLGMLFITPLALTISTTASDVDAATISMDRILATILGAAIALGVLYVSEWCRSRSKIPRGL